MRGWLPFYRTSWRLGLDGLAGRRNLREALTRLLIPLDPSRYLEFPDAVRELDARPGQRVLDLASPKLVAVEMARRGVEVTSVDAFDAEVERWRSLAGERPRLRFERADGRDLPFADASFDHAFSISVVEHIPGDGDAQALRELARVVRPGGRVVLTVPYAEPASEDWRDAPVYGSQEAADGRCFFERWYDPAGLERLTAAAPGLRMRSSRVVRMQPNWHMMYHAHLPLAPRPRPLLRPHRAGARGAPRRRGSPHPGAHRAMTPRRILLVCHFYPPSAGAAVQRPLSMAKYLRRMGHSVTILTTGAFGSLPDDAEREVVRTYDLQLLQARLRGESQATPILEAETYSNRPHPLSYVLVPEALVVAWTPFALARSVALHRRERFDCVITTSPPESGHLAGYALQRLGAAWIADIRDGWNFESYRPAWRTKLQERADRALERSLMRSADAVTCVAEPLADYFRTEVGANAAVITNGWDPELLDGIQLAAAPDLLDPERVSLVHAGRLEVVDRDPRPLVEALAALARDDPDAAARLELVFAGAFTERERELFERDVSPARIVVAGNLPRPETLALEHAADGLLLVTAGSRRHEVTGKLFEYLGVGRPILALAEGTEAGRIVQDSGAGRVIPTGDVGAARKALEAFARGEVPAPAAEARRAYAYPAVAERMAEQVEAVTRRAAGGRRAGRGRRPR